MIVNRINNHYLVTKRNTVVVIRSGLEGLGRFNRPPARAPLIRHVDYNKQNLPKLTRTTEQEALNGGPRANLDGLLIKIKKIAYTARCVRHSYRIVIVYGSGARFISVVYSRRDDGSIWASQSDAIISVDKFKQSKTRFDGSRNVSYISHVIV